MRLRQSASRQISLYLAVFSICTWLPIFPLIDAQAAPANKEGVHSSRTKSGSEKSGIEKAGVEKAGVAQSGAESSARPTSQANANAKTSGNQALDGDRPIRDKWAVVIGINEFQNKRIPQLNYSVKDARDFADFLVNYGNFARDHVLLLLNQDATNLQIKRAIGSDWLPRRVLEDDVVLIYASTHGSPKELDVAGQNFLVVYDTDPDDLFPTSIELDDLAGTIKQRTRCDRVVLLLDACNSGAAATGEGGKGLINNNTANFDLSSIAGEGIIVISSSAATQRSWESKRYQNGVFTHSIMEAFKKTGTRTRIADAFADLKDSVEQEVMFDRKASQTPVMLSKWTGKTLSVMAPPVRPRPTEPYQLVSSSDNQAGGQPGSAGQIGNAAAATNTDNQQIASAVTPGAGFNQGTAQNSGTKNSGTKNSGTQSAGTQSSGTQSSGTQNSITQNPGTHRPGEITAGSIALVNFGAPQAINISHVPGVLWGIVERPDELRRLNENLDNLLGRRLGKLVTAYSASNIAELSPEGYLAGNPAADTLIAKWKPEDFRRAAQKANVSYFLYGTVNEASWYPTTWSNRYSLVASATLVDATTGRAVATANRITVCKAPWTADMSGGKTYFENYVVPDLADELLKELRQQSRLKF